MAVMGAGPDASHPTAWYAATIARFRAASTNEVVGALTRSGSFAVTESQRMAWENQIEILRDATAELDGRLWLEFDVPRLGSRIDAVIVSGPAIVPIEFKVGAIRHTRDDFE